MSETDEMRRLADSLGEYVWKNHIAPRLAGTVRFYRAVVTDASAGGKITVQRPCDAPVSLPYVGSAARLQAGDQCVVLALGDDSNSIILGDGTLSNL